MSLIRSKPRSQPGYRPAGCGQFVGNFILLGAVAGVIVGLWSRSIRGAVIAGILGAALLVFKGMKRKSLQLAVSQKSIRWFHPERGGGELAWDDIGALIIRDFAGGEELVLYLVPHGSDDPDADPEAYTGFILSTNDMGKRGPEGEGKLKQFVEQVMPYLSAEIAIDRGTRRWLDRWRMGRK